MNVHPETFIQLADLGSKIPPYLPTYDFAGSFIDRSHSYIGCCRRKDDTLIQMKNRRWFGTIIPGWLRREDALKLYELAYFTATDILELGSFHGLSTSVLARANRNSGRSKHIFTFDLDPSCVKATKHNLRCLGLDRNVTILCDDATVAARRFASQGKRFGFVFIDHSHEYGPVHEVCRELTKIVAAGGFCLFHDFNDVRNRNPDDKDYGVYQAVMDGLDHDRFEFCGIYGCTGLYRAKANG